MDFGSIRRMVMRDSLFPVGYSHLPDMSVCHVKCTGVRIVVFGDCGWCWWPQLRVGPQWARKSNRQVEARVRDATVSVCLYAYPSRAERLVMRTGLTGPNYYLSR